MILPTLSKPPGTSRRLYWAAILLIIATLALELLWIGRPMIEHHPYKQFSVATVSRWFYYLILEHVQGRIDVPPAGFGHHGILEPPFLESLSAVVYWILGREDISAVRLIPVAFWLASAYLVFDFCLLLFSPVAAFAGLCFFLFNYCSLIAAKSYQEDILMMFFFVGWLWAMVGYFILRDRRFLKQAVVSGFIAIFLKPHVLFLVGAVVAALAKFDPDFRAELARRETRRLAIFLSVPFIVYYAVAAISGPSEGRIMPSLIGHLEFFPMWLAQIELVIGVVAFSLSLCSAFVLADGVLKILLKAFWVGYLVFGLVFTYHSHTHSYYSLPLIPIVSLSLGVLIKYVEEYFISSGRSLKRLKSIGFAGIFCFIGGNIWYYVSSMQEMPFEYPIEYGVRVGNVVNHSSKVIFFDRTHGYFPGFYGSAWGFDWPQPWAMRKLRLMGRPELSNAERLNLYLSDGAEYFVAEKATGFDQLTELKSLLASRYTLIHEDPMFVAYDLRNASLKK